MDNELIETGRIVNTHGMHGELRVQPWADSPELLTGFDHFYIEGAPVKVMSAKVHKSCVIIALEGVADIDAAIKMKNKIVSVKKNDIKLGENKYFIADLIGLRVIDAESFEDIGIISDVLTYPANNIYVIKRNSIGSNNSENEILVPAVSEYILETNLLDGYVKLRVIEGM